MNKKISDLFLQKRYLDVIKEFEADPNAGKDLELFDSVISAYQFVRQHDRAVKLCEQGISLAKSQKDKSHYEFKLAQLYAEESPEKALEIIKKHLEVFKSSFHGLALAINLCSELGKYGELESFYQQAAGLIKNLSDEQRKRYGGLIAKVYRAYSKYLEKMAREQHSPEKIYEAITICKLSLEYDDGDALGWYELGKCYFESQKWEDAEAALQKSLAINPHPPYVKRMLAKTINAKGDKEAALKLYSELCMQSVAGYICWEAGQCAESLNENRKAGQFYKQAIQKEPRKWYPRFLLGQLYIKLNAKEQAIQTLKECSVLYEKEVGQPHTKSLELIAQCGKMEKNEEITFRESKTVKKETGQIIKYVQDRGFGFLKFNSLNLFFHISKVLDINTHGEPKVGQNIAFRQADSEKGPVAIDIERI